MKPDDIPLFPVVSLTVATVPTMRLVIIRPDFLSHPLQSVDEATPGRTYALTDHQAETLVQQIQSALAKLPGAESTPVDEPRH